MKTLLIVEDCDSTIELIRALLMPSGIHVIAAHTAEEGYRRAKIDHPDGIIIDMLLPGNGDGLDFVRVLRADADLQNTPLLGLSGAPSGANYLPRFRAVCDDFIQKPFHTVQLQDAVRQLLQLSDPGKPQYT